MRLKISDLYGALSDMVQRQRRGILRANEPNAGDFSSDFKPEKHMLGGTNAFAFGRAMASILNIYGCVPIAAAGGTKNYNLFSMGNSARNIYQLVTGNTAEIDAAAAQKISEFYQALGMEGRWVDPGTVIDQNLRYRFPVLAKDQDGNLAIIGGKVNGLYMDTEGNELSFQPVKVIDTYQYLLDVSKDAKNITDSVSKTESFYNRVRFLCPTEGSITASVCVTDANGKVIGFEQENGEDKRIAIKKEKVIENNEEVTYGFFSTEACENNEKILLGIETKYEGVIPDIYGGNKLYKVIKYSDLQAAQTDAWYYPYLFKATNLGIIGGDTDAYENGELIPGDGTRLYFNPEKPVSRSEFLKMIIETAAVSDEEKQTAMGVIEETDPALYQTIDGHWAKEYLCFGVNKGIISSLQASQPDENLMRTEAAYMVHAMFLGNRESVQAASNIYEYSKGISCERNTYWKEKTAFEDQTTAQFRWNEEAIYQLYMNNVMEGSDDGYFYPTGTLKRSEAAKIVTKCLYELEENIKQVQLIFEGYDNVLQFNTGIGRPTAGWPEEYNIYAARSGYYFVGVQGSNLNGNDYSLQKRVENADNTYHFEELTDDFTMLFGASHVPEDVKSGLTKDGYTFKRYYIDKNTGLKLRNIRENVTRIIVKEPQNGDVAVKQKGGGRYIFSNSPETITNDYVADNGDGKRGWIMRNGGLEAGDYTLALYHHTKLTYPVKVDAEFYAKTDTTITFTRFGMGKPVSEWTSINVYADYIGQDILKKEGTVYEGRKFTDLPYTRTIPAGERVWLSEIYEALYHTDDYPTIGGYNERGEHDINPVFGMMDFTIEGLADVNLLARRYDVNSDKINWNGDASYVFENHHKGVANSLPETGSELWFEVNNGMTDLTKLSGTVFNVKNPFGKNLADVGEGHWYTHINPQSDTWTGDDGSSVEMDMFALNYTDENKKSFYGSSIPESEKDEVWRFDTVRTQVRSNNVRAEENDAGIMILHEKEGTIHPEFKPNDFLHETDLTIYEPNIQNLYSNLLAASLGNYGVVERYRINVTNTGSKSWYLCYEMDAIAHMVIECNGTYRISYPDMEGVYPVKTKRQYALGMIEPNTTTTIEFSVVLPTADRAGVGNKLYIRDKLTYPTEEGKTPKSEEIIF